MDWLPQGGGGPPNALTTESTTMCYRWVSYLSRLDVYGRVGKNIKPKDAPTITGCYK